MSHLFHAAIVPNREIMAVGLTIFPPRSNLIADLRANRIHAFRDLKAYVCTAGQDECDAEFFGDRDAWFEHELKEHRARYKCSLCNHRPLSPKDIRNHIQTVHGPFTSDQLRMLQDAGREAVTSFRAQDCPFCFDWRDNLRKKSNPRVGLGSPDQNTPDILVSASRFKRHVATHQEQLAIFALPRAAEEDGTPVLGSVGVSNSDAPSLTKPVDPQEWDEAEASSSSPSSGEVDTSQRAKSHPDGKFEYVVSMQGGAKFVRRQKSAGQTAEDYPESSGKDIRNEHGIRNISPFDTKYWSEKGLEYLLRTEKTWSSGPEVPAPAHHGEKRSLDTPEYKYAVGHDTHEEDVTIRNKGQYLNTTRDIGKGSYVHGDDGEADEAASDSNPLGRSPMTPAVGRENRPGRGLETGAFYGYEFTSPSDLARYDLEYSTRSSRQKTKNSHDDVTIYDNLELSSPASRRVPKEEGIDLHYTNPSYKQGVSNPDDSLRQHSHTRGPNPDNPAFNESFPTSPTAPCDRVTSRKIDSSAHPDARWTKISRDVVSPEALAIGKERFEVRDDFVVVLRVLTREEITRYAGETAALRGK